ncbi:MAG: DUF72 domain-containing protein [Planctomycetes bacterium]|nr:DUF72 domain-containing protein [Planctomycetota bacterium]
MSTSPEVRYGTAGWSFPDWYGSFYPQRKVPDGPGSLFTGLLETGEHSDVGLAKREPLRYYARYFDVVEVNSSFYGIPRPTTSARWADLTERDQGPPFLFSAKVPQTMTHEGRILPREVQAFHDFLAPLRDRERLTAVLAQFPGHFAWSPRAKGLLEELREALAGLPLVVEVRHASWQATSAVDFLRGQEATLASIDMPQARDTLPPSELVTQPELAYVRLHGRNGEAWFDSKAGRDQRYDYLYSPPELDGWARRISTLSSVAKKTLVIANNHYRGQAPANALELRRLGGEDVTIPPALGETYPRLGS